MITRRTKVQLLIFAVITLFGVSFVGARYADLTRFVHDSNYTVVAHYSDSGGIFAGGEVTYRGVGIGRVDKLELTDDGVDVYLSIEDDYDTIPADTLAVVGNRSAVGEQYVELQPQTDDGPYLEEGSQVEEADTRTPLSTEQFLTDIATTVGSVDRDALRTTVDELGKGFYDTGRDLQRIIDTGNRFINTASDNLQTTAALIRDSNVVLRTQVDKATAIRSFAKNLSLFSDTLAGANPDLIRLIENGSPAATQLRTFLDDNKVQLGQLINNLLTTGQVVVKHLDGIEQTLVLYPYVVEGGFTVVAKSPDSGLYDAHFGLILTEHTVCHGGYEGTDTRPPQDGSNRPMNEKAGCTEPAAMSNPRGPQNLPGQYRTGALAGRTIASYDPSTGSLRWGSRVPADSSSPGTVAPRTLGEETWKWLLIQPLTAR